MTLNDLLTDKGIEPGRVLVLRHRPSEPKLNKVLPWLAAEKPHVFNAYQQHQGKQLESVMQKMQGAGYVASFIGNSPGKALFIGLYEISSSKRRCCMIQLRREWGRFSNFSFRTPQRRISAYPARPSG